MAHNEGGSLEGSTWKQVTGILALVSVIPIWWAVNDRHMTEIDNIYARKTDVMLLAQASDLQKQVAIISEAEEANAQKLDFLVKSEAARTVTAIRQEISIHKANRDDTQMWQRELVDMETRLQRAENYKFCVVSGHFNCDAERIW